MWAKVVSIFKMIGGKKKLLLDLIAKVDLVLDVVDNLIAKVNKATKDADDIVNTANELVEQLKAEIEEKDAKIAHLEMQVAVHEYLRKEGE